MIRALSSRFFVLFFLAFSALHTFTAGCEFDSSGTGETDATGGSEMGEDPPPPPTPPQVKVCVDRPPGEFATALQSKPIKLPARWVKIEWLLDGQSVTQPGRTDEEGYYRQEDNTGILKDSKFCAKFEENQSFQTQLRYSAPGPDGNTIQYSVPLNFETTDQDLSFMAQPLTERVLTNPVIVNQMPNLGDNDKALEARSFPLIATHDFNQNPPKDLKRVSYGSAGAKHLTYHAGNIANNEAALGNSFVAGSVGAPNFTDNGGVLVLDYLSYYYDYSSSGLTTMDMEKDLFFGFGENLDSTYATLAVYIAPSANFRDNPCLEQQTFSLENAYSPLEEEFRTIVQNNGGVLRGILPGYFWAGYQLQALQANTTSDGGFSSQAIGTTYYTNLPLWDYDATATGNTLLNILVVEVEKDSMNQDSDTFNDLVACFGNVDISDIQDKPVESLLLNNKVFLEANGIYPLFNRETLKLNLQFRSKVTVK